MTHLLIVSIGPVQEFIASARRSRDLWFGSWLLSELAKAAALAIVEQDGLDNLIFPAPTSLEDLQAGSELNVANKVIAEIQRPAAEVAQQIRDKIWAQLHIIRDQAYKFVNATEFDQENAWKQIDDLPDVYWAALEIPNRHQYHAVRAELEALMAARKVTRNFSAVTWGSPIPKSSLDGMRESVIPEYAYDREANLLYQQYGVRPGERLCGVGLLKRHGVRGTNPHFSSTSHLAAWPLLQQIDDQVHVETYIKKLRDLKIAEDDLYPVEGTPFGYDGHLIFEERLSEFFEDKDVLTKARAALYNFRSAAWGGKSPSPYYALLAADGDRMGATIDNLRDIDSHRKLSVALSKFARKAPNIVRTNGGSPIYAGGDDVLALVPLPKALACAQQLAQEFRNTIAGFKDEDAQSPTLSVGIVITHHLEPLQDALGLARRAEKAAKKLDGKDALAVTLSKRSGEDRTVVGRWGDIDKRLASLISLYGAQKIPSGVAYELLRLASLLSELDEAVAPRISEVETLRILKRKRGQQGRTQISDIDTAMIEDALGQIENSPKVIGDDAKNSLAELASEMIIASVLANQPQAKSISTSVVTNVGEMP